MTELESARGELRTGERVWRTRGVVGIGLGSLLSDAGHEMATAALPGFLRSIGAPAAALGAIEGVADAALSASKVAAHGAADVDEQTVAGVDPDHRCGRVGIRSPSAGA